MDRLKSLGYVGNPTARGNRGIIPDWTHVNAVAYNAELDQIMICVRSFGEFWIIDHGTTTTEAAGHTGWKARQRWRPPLPLGQPDLLPRRHAGGSTSLRPARRPLDSQWVPRAGHVLVFNNGGGRPAGNYSSVDEIVLPVNAQGDYTQRRASRSGRAEPIWSYTAPKKEELFAFIMSGANRLPNGNTLICESISGTIFEVTHKGETVWKYANPAGGSFAMGMPGGPPMGGPPTLADVLPPPFQFMLNLTSEQRKKLDATQKEVISKLETILNAPQRKQLLERRAADPMGFAGMAAPGMVLPSAAQIAIKLSTNQKTELATLQKEVDSKIQALLDDDQKDQMKQMRAMMARGGPPGFRPGGPPAGPGAPPPGPGGPPGPPGGFGGNSVFRAYRYPMDYPGLAGKDLTPGKTVEELERKARRR